MTEKHVHKLKRLRYKSGNEIYFCTLPDCNYKIKPQLALGKRSICWRCGDEFLLNEYSLRLAKPHCEKCHQSKDGHPLTPISVINSVTQNDLGSTESLMDRLKIATAFLEKGKEEDI